MSFYQQTTNFITADLKTSENIYDKAAKEIFALYSMEKQKLTKLQEERNKMLSYIYAHKTVGYTPVGVGKLLFDCTNDALGELELKIQEQSLILIGIGKSYKRLCNKADMENQ